MVSDEVLVYDLMWAKNVATVFGTKPHTVQVWRGRGVLVEEVTSVSSRPLWTLDVLVEWGLATDRRIHTLPGRLDVPDIPVPAGTSAEDIDVLLRQRRQRLPDDRVRLSQLMGITEMAEMFGVDEATVKVWGQRGVLEPQYRFETKAPVWTVPWAVAWGEKNGRPPKIIPGT